MLKRQGILVLLFLSILAKAQYFNPEAYVLHNIDLEGESQTGKMAGLIIKNKRGLDSEGILKSLEAMPTDSFNINQKINYYLLKAANYNLSQKYKNALENAMLALHLAEKNNLSPQAELATLMEATTYYHLRSNKNLATFENNKLNNPDVAFQLDFMLAEAGVKVANGQNTIKLCNRLLKSSVPGKYDRAQVLQLYTQALEHNKQFKEALAVNYECDSILTEIRPRPMAFSGNPRLFYNDLNLQTFDQKVAFEQIIVKNNSGFLLLKMNDLKRAESMFYEALSLARESKNKNCEFEIEKNIGLTFTLSKRYAEADKNYWRAEQISVEEGNTRQQSEVLCMRAKNYYLASDLVRARDLCETSLKLADADNNYRQLANCYLVLAEINAYVGNIQKSAYYNKLSEENAAKAQQGNSIAEVESKANDLKEEAAYDVFAKEKAGLELIQLKLEATKRYQELEIIQRENQIKESKITAEKLETEKAQQALLMVKRELENLSQLKELDEMKRIRAINILENKNNQTKIRMLNKQRRFDAEIKASRENDIRQAKNREKNLRALLLISFIITGLIVFLLYRNVRSARVIRQSNKKLEELTISLKSTNSALETTLEEVNTKNAIIELKNSQILESITYAQRIQEASLPKRDELESLAKDSFVFYKPKDIISGDFYLVSQFKTRLNTECTVYIVGDCTGHGVPGAMLSLLCSSLVRQSLRLENINSPADILNEVNQKLRNFFRSKEDDGFTDGMDLACCAIDKFNNKLYFSGAGRPLICIRDAEAIELKGEKHHIGFSNTSYHFSDQVLDLKAGDAIYLFTDGYTDQFNGRTRKRFMTKNFKEMLISVNQRPMQEQLTELEKTFEAWRGDYVQMDDVCVLGIKI